MGLTRPVPFTTRRCISRRRMHALRWEDRKMAGTSPLARLIPFLVTLHSVMIADAWAQAPASAPHEHLTEVACVDVAPGEKRPEFGCFNVGTAAGLVFKETAVYWHLRAFPDRKGAEAARSTRGIVVEEDGRVWLSEFGPRISTLREGTPIAVVGPLQLPPAKTYTAVVSYAVMR